MVECSAKRWRESFVIERKAKAARHGLDFDESYTSQRLVDEVIAMEDHGG